MNTHYIRRIIISGIILLMFIIIIIQLFMLQVVDSSYKLSASNNVLRSQTLFPARGIVYDRDSNILIYNEAAYDIMVIPGQLKEFDTTAFCQILEISKSQLKENIQKAVDYSKLKPSIFLKQISSLTYASLQEKMYKFPGFYVQPRTLRKYPKSIAAHVLGYVGEVDVKTIRKDLFYESGDYYGMSGIENSYETYLRGEKGVKIFLVDVHNRIKGSYKNGKFDSPSIAGKNLVATINSDLQEYGEKLMANKIGSIVALEPSSGEILSLISAPNYDPSLLVGRIRNYNYKILSNDTLNPLFNRALMAQYPPGSTFKLVNALVALQEKVIWSGTEYMCNYGFYSKGIFVGCHKHNEPTTLKSAIQYSCNTYFCQVFKRIIENPFINNRNDAFNSWINHVKSFGIGRQTGTDFSNEVIGILPSTEYYDRYYGQKGWNALTIISLSIGQGEIGCTPLQLANMTATIANKGYYYIPHIVKSIEGKDSIDRKYRTKNYASIDSIHFENIIKGMYLSVNGGAGSTGWRAKMDNITVCGKTGTAENPFGEPHSIFVAFAPLEDPKIAISVYIENGGAGTLWAVPIARLMIEKYLNDSISIPYLEDYITSANLLNRREKKY
ncbi:penicillin-binding protein 2 [Bacteroidota bacterium]